MIKEENINTWLTQLESESKAAISVDCVVFGYDESGLKLLLIECNMPPYEGQLSLLGDLLKNNETLLEAAKRILLTTTGLTEVFLEQVSSFSKPNRHPLGRVVTLAYMALIKIEDYEIFDHQHRHLHWIPIKDVKEMAFDHKEILDACFAQLQNRIREKPIGFSLLPKKFSLMQLQNLYETVLGVKLDKRNFRRKLHNLHVLIDLGESQTSVSHRPAKLYSFNEAKINTRFSI